MAKGPAQGIRTRFDRRPGVGGFPEWLGVKKEGDTASLAPNQFRDLINVRLKGSSIQVRGGQSKLIASPLAGAAGESCVAGGAGGVTGIFPAEFDPQVVSCPSSFASAMGAAVGARLYHPAWSSSGLVRDLQAYDETNGMRRILTGDGVTIEYLEAMVADGTTRLVYLTRPSGVANFKLWTIPRDSITPTLKVTDSTYSDPRVVWIVRLSSTVYAVGIQNGSVDGRLHLWDGSSASTALELNMGANHFSATGAVFAGDVYAHDYLSTGGTGQLLKRSGGGWGTVFADPQADFIGNDSVVFQSNLYIGGNTLPVAPRAGIINKFNGTVQSVARSIVSSSSLPLVPRFHCMAVIDNILYYVWFNPALPNVLNIGKFDGSTWTDSWAALPGSPVGEIIAASLADYGGKVYLATYVLASSRTSLWVNNDRTLAAPFVKISEGCLSLPLGPPAIGGIGANAQAAGYMLPF